MCNRAHGTAGLHATDGDIVRATCSGPQCQKFPAPDTPTAILVDHGAAMDTSLARREILPAVDQYTEQAEAFALAVLNKKTLPWGIEDAIQNMRILDAIFASEKSKSWASVAA